MVEDDQQILDLLNTCLELNDQTGSVEGWDAVSLIDSIIDCCLRTGDGSRAEKLALRNVTDMEKEYGKGDFNILSSLKKLADVYSHSSELAQAEAILRNALDIAKSEAAEQIDVYGNCTQDLINLFLEHENYERAESEITLMLAEFEQMGEEGEQWRRSHLHTLSQIYLESGRNAEAESIFKHLIDTIDSGSYGGEYMQRDLQQQLGYLYESTGRADEAQAIFDALKEGELDESEEDPFTAGIELHEEKRRKEQLEELQKFIDAGELEEAISSGLEMMRFGVLGFGDMTEHKIDICEKLLCVYQQLDRPDRITEMEKTIEDLRTHEE